MSSTSQVVYAPRVRSSHYRDVDGAMTTVIGDGELVALSVDWTDALASGETVSSVAYSASGPTVASVSLVTPVWSATVTGTGTIDVTATTSAGRKVLRTLRYVSPDCAVGYSGSSGTESDYGDET